MELISREEVLKHLNQEDWRTPDEKWWPEREIGKLIDYIPTVESRPTGVWVGIDEYPHEEWECNNCGNIINTFDPDELEEHKYCHACGAKMLVPWGEVESEE